MDVSMGTAGMVIGVLALAVWIAVCCWVIAAIVRLDAALVSKVVWGVVILAFPVVGLIAFLLVGDRTGQMERELGIRRS